MTPRALLLAACLAAGPACGQTDERAQVETLIERSSAARQIEASGSPEAHARRARAREALARGELAEARRLMLQAVRLAPPEKLLAERAKADFDARMESAQALLVAQKRVSSEKGSGEEATRRAEQRLDAALRLRQEGRLDAAREQLEQAYLIAKTSLGALRQGDTLVRSLSFASKEEEYRYELDRNDTHQMLLRLLLEGKQATLAGLVERARKLRGQAEEGAARGDHAAAVKLLEESTVELVRAIRSAGVYIPG